MAYRIELHKLNKRPNSTKVPTENGTRYGNVVLKEGSSLFNPQIQVTLSNSDSVNLSMFNYFYFQENINDTWETIGGLYKITDITNDYLNTWTISGTIDALGTLSTTIKSSSQYVVRTSKKMTTDQQGEETAPGWDERQFDELAKPTTKLISHTRNTLSSGFSTSNTITVMGFNGRNMEFYATRTSPQGVANGAIDTSDVLNLIEENLGRYNDYFTTSKIFPFDISGSDEWPDSDTWIGTKQTVCSHGKEIDLKNISGTDTTTELSRVKRIEATYNNVAGIACVNIETEYDDFRRYDNRFTSIVANCPFVGQIDIDPVYLNYERLNFVYKIDLISGVGELSVYASISGINKQIGFYSCQVGIDVPIANYNTNWYQIGQQAYNKDIKALAEDYFSPPTDKLTLSNTSGFASSLIGSIYIDVKQYESVDLTYGARKGKPCNELITLGTLPSGTYVECLNPSISATSLQYVIDEAQSQMASGIYIE